MCADRHPAPLDDRDPLRDRRGRRRRRGDLRVRHPAEARQRTIVSTSAMPEGLDAAGIDAFVADALRRGRGPLPPRRGRPGRARRRPGRHPGPVRGVRGRRLRRRRRARPPRLHRRRAHHRPAHARRRCWTRSSSSARPPATRSRPRRSSSRCTGDWRRWPPRCGSRTQPPPRVLLLEWTDPPYAPGHWVPEMVALAGAVPDPRRGRRAVGADHLGAGAGQSAGPGRLRTVRLPPRRLGDAGAGGAGLRPDPRRDGRCGRSTPTPPGHGQDRDSSTASRH